MGFAAEIKEFLGAAKDTWKLASDTDYKTALQKQAEEATTKSREEREDPEEAESKKLKNALLRAKIASENSAAAGEATTKSALQAANEPIPIAAPKPAIDTTTTTAAPAVMPAPQFSGTGRKNVYGDEHAKGGLVRKFAVGGVVNDDDLEEDTPSPQQAVPTASPGVASAVGPAIGGMSTDFSARRRAAQPMPDTGVTAGLKYLAEQSGIGQEAIQPALRQQALQRYARGAGGAPAVDMAQVYKKIDKDGTMPESVRNLNAINSVYNFYQAAGDPTKAKSAAAQMLQFNRTANSQYLALAKAAAADGNMDAATKMFTKSYANVPDGSDGKLWKDKDGNIGYTITNADGTKTNKGIMTPQQFGSMLMKVQPTDFDQHLITAASERYNDAQGQPIVKPGRAKASSANEDVSGDSAQGKILEGVTKHVGDWLDDLKASKDPAKIKAAEDFSLKERKALETSMYHLQRNNDMPAAQAFDAAKTYLTAPEPKKEGDPIPFKVSRAKGSDTVTIQFASDGQTVEMPVNQFKVMDKLRDDMLAEQEAKAEKARKDAIEDAKPGAAGKARELLFRDPEGPGQAALAAGKAIVGPGGLGGAYEGAKKGVGAAVKGALGAADEFVKDAGTGIAATHPGLTNALKNPNVDVTNPDDRPL